MYFAFTRLGDGSKGFVKERLGEEFDDLMTDFSKKGYSGAVLVAQNGEIVLRKGYGLADRERKIQKATGF
ncbi:MAG: hypothetical protein M3388_14520 [Acidobacteriota bacterium]|nr:hypothetical protein [Acidobacteriota bacterium]